MSGMEGNINKNSQSKEIAEWHFRASGLEAEHRAIEEIAAKRKKLEADSANFNEKLKTRLASTLFQLEPGKFVIVKPSKRQNAVKAGYLADNIVFWNDKREYVPLKTHVDYKVWDTRIPWQGGELTGENETWFSELLKEIDEQKT